MTDGGSALVGRRRWLAAAGWVGTLVVLIGGLVVASTVSGSSDDQTVPVSSRASLKEPIPLPTSELDSSDAPVAVTATTLAPRRPPSLSISCPEPWVASGLSYEIQFGHTVAPGTAEIDRYEIDYGDGRSYGDRVGREAAVFEHTYAAPGTYSVVAKVIDRSGWSDTVACMVIYQLASSGGGGYPPGGFNDAGCPRDQYVSGYYRKDGTYVRGYYRNSASDGCGGG